LHAVALGHLGIVAARVDDLLGPGVLIHHGPERRIERGRFALAPVAVEDLQGAVAAPAEGPDAGGRGIDHNFLARAADEIVQDRHQRIPA